MSATLFFLQLKDARGQLVAGESTATGYRGQIELEGISWSMKAEHSPLQDDKVSTQVQYENVTLTKFYDRSSPGLARAMFGGDSSASPPLPFQSALISVVDMVFDQEKSSGVPVVEIKLEDGFIEDIKIAVSEAGKSMQVKETLLLSFRHVKLTYFKSTGDRLNRGTGFYFEGDAASIDG